MDRRIDLTLAGAVAVFGAVLFILASNITLGQIDDPVGPRGLPTALAIMFVGAGVILVVRRVLDGQQGQIVEPDGAEDEPGHPASARRAFAAMAGSALYIWALPSLGYMVATPPLLMGLMWLLGLRSVRLMVAVALLYTVVVHIVFTQVLSVALPGGVLSGPLRALGLD